MFDFIDISFIDVLDVLMVGLLIYWLIRVVRGTSAVNIFLGVLLLYVIWIASRALGMKLLSFILGQVLGVGVVALLVIFQPEIRRFLLRISSSTTVAQKGFFNKLFRHTKTGGIQLSLIHVPMKTLKIPCNQSGNVCPFFLAVKKI